MKWRRITTKDLKNRLIDIHSHAGVSLKAYAAREYPYAASVEDLAYRQKACGIDVNVVFPLTPDLFFDPRKLAQGRNVPARRPLYPSPYAVENELLLQEILRPGVQAWRRTACLALMAAFSTAGCRQRQPPASPVIMSFEDILQQPLIKTSSGLSAREIPGAPSKRLLYVDIPEEFPLRYAMWYPTSFFIVQGRMDIRAGSLRRLLGPGSYVFIPKQMSFSIRRIGKERLIVAYREWSDESDWFSLQAPLSLLK